MQVDVEQPGPRRVELVVLEHRVVRRSSARRRRRRGSRADRGRPSARDGARAPRRRTDAPSCRRRRGRPGPSRRARRRRETALPASSRSLTSSLMRSPAIPAGKCSEGAESAAALAGGPVGLDAALDLRDVEPELALSLARAAPRGWRAGPRAARPPPRAARGRPRGPRGRASKSFSRCVELAAPLAELALELARPPLAPLEALARTRPERRRRPDRVLELLERAARAPPGLCLRAPASCASRSSSAALGGREALVLVRARRRARTSRVEVLDLDLDDRREEPAGRGGVAAARLAAQASAGAGGARRRGGSGLSGREGLWVSVTAARHADGR